MGGAQPLAVTMNDGVALCIDVDRAHAPATASRPATSTRSRRLRRRRGPPLRRGASDAATGAVGRPRRQRRRCSLPALLERDFPADIVTDQTSAHDPLSYMPRRSDARGGRRDGARPIPTSSSAEPGRRWPTHCAAMVGFMDRGAEVFDYGNSLRAEAKLGGFDRAFDYPGFLPAYIRPLFCEGKGPFRWVALSGDPADIAATDRAVLEEFPDDEGLHRWIRLAGERVAFQGLPARICWLGYGERHRLGLRFNEMVRTGEL